MIKEIIRRNKDKKTLLEHEVKGMFREMGFAVPEGIFIRKGESIPAGLSLGYPLIAKISSAKIASKSDVNGVRTDIKNDEELKRNMEELMRIEHAEGVLVEEMAPRGIEVIVGGIIDKQFGPVVMFGLGGVFVELFRDTAFALAPLKKDDALWLIRQVKGYKLIDGYRGKPALDKDALVKILVAVSEIMATNLIEEIDLNPVALYPAGAMVLDAKMKIAAH